MPNILRSTQASVAVLGAGIQGCCLALELARRGISVHLLDCHPEPLLGASTNNEGKLHLGFVYAKDPDRATHDLMVRGLHQRFAIGPRRHGAYVTIDTGKYCTAPLFAQQAAEMLTEVLA